MPEKETRKRAAADKRKGKSSSTQAGEYVREEIHHVRSGKHGARSPEQAIAIGLSKARRAGVKVPSKKDKKSAKASHKKNSKPSRKRSQARLRVLKGRSHSTASHTSLSKHAKESASSRGRASRHRAAMKAVRTKGKKSRQQAARKAARTRKEAA